MQNNEITNLILKVIIASFGSVGIMEYIKNFLKTKKTYIYSIIMPFIAVGCFLATEYLPIGIIGGIVTVGCVQLDYQVIVQGFKNIMNKSIRKIKENDNETSGIY